MVGRRSIFTIFHHYCYSAAFRTFYRWWSNFQAQPIYKQELEFFRWLKTHLHHLAFIITRLLLLLGE